MTFQSIIQSVQESYNTKEFIPLHPPVFVGKEKEYLIDTIDSTFVSSVGQYVNRFEDEMSKLSATRKSVAVVNGTAAIQISLRLANVKPGNEVITQALTFVATANAISYVGATPIFVDVDLDTMGISPKALEAFLNEYGELREDGTYNKSTGCRISACIPMHTFGFMCRISKIVEICNKWKIPVIEDAAEALGSSYNGKPAGSFGKLGAFSFNGNKIITAGGGGAIVSNDESLANRAKHITTTAKVPHSWEYVHDELGFNYRMPNINAALACAQLESFDVIRMSKKNLYDDYSQRFSEENIKLKAIPSETDWNYWLMSVELFDKGERDLFLKETNENGVMTRPIWQLMHRLPMYNHCFRDDQKNAEYLEERIVNIPSGARL